MYLRGSRSSAMWKPERSDGKFHFEAWEVNGKFMWKLARSVVKWKPERFDGKCRMENWEGRGQVFFGNMRNPRSRTGFMHKPGRFENISEAEILSPRECEEKLDSYFNTGSLQELLLCFVGHCMFNKQGRFEILFKLSWYVVLIFFQEKLDCCRNVQHCLERWF